MRKYPADGLTGNYPFFFGRRCPRCVAGRAFVRRIEPGQTADLSPHLFGLQSSELNIPVRMPTRSFLHSEPRARSFFSEPYIM